MEVQYKVRGPRLWDDIALLSSTRQHIQTKTEKLAHEAGRVGLKVNVDRSGGGKWA